MYLCTEFLGALYAEPFQYSGEIIETSPQQVAEKGKSSHLREFGLVKYDNLARLYWLVNRDPYNGLWKNLDIDCK